MAEQLNAKQKNSPSPLLENLPDTVLLQILNFLPLIDAVTTSLISRKWRNLWHSMPRLKFNIKEFPWHDDDTPSTIPGTFANFISLALLHRSNTKPLEKFSLLFHYIDSNNRFRNQITSWIRYSLNCGVVNLKLDFGVAIRNGENGGNRRYEFGDGHGYYTSSDYEGQYYDFHFLDLNNSSVRVLALRTSRLIMPISNAGRFESLQSVSLVEVFMSDEMLADVISKCVNLEKLDLSKFRGVKKFKILSEKLKELELSCYFPPPLAVEEVESEPSLEICAPQLCSIRFHRFYVKKYEVRNLSSLVEVDCTFYCIDEFALECWSNVMLLFSDVKRLTVLNMWSKFISSKLKPTESFELTKLKHLELETGYTVHDYLGLWEVLKRSPALETLVLNYACPTTAEDASFCKDFQAVPFWLDIPILSLREIIMKNYRKTNPEHLMLVLVAEHTRVLEKIVLIPKQCRPVVICTNYGQLWVDTLAECFKGGSSSLWSKSLAPGSLSQTVLSSTSLESLKKSIKEKVRADVKQNMFKKRMYRMLEKQRKLFEMNNLKFPKICGSLYDSDSDVDTLKTMVEIQRRIFELINFKFPEEDFARLCDSDSDEDEHEHEDPATESTTPPQEDVDNKIWIFG